MSAAQPTTESNLVHPAAQCEQMWQCYCDSWSITTNPARQQSLERCLTPTFTMTGNTAVYNGYDGLQASMTAFQAREPGAVFVTKGMVWHHAVGKVEWEVMAADGKRRLFGGVDFLEFGEDGRIGKIVAFLS